MPVIIPNNKTSKPFIPHPAGRHLAVCADVFLLEEPNYFYGKRGMDGKIDERETTTNLHIAFLTDNLTEDGKPSYISEKFTASCGDKSKLAIFLRTWLPELANENLWKYDFEKLIGRKAELTTIINPHKTNPQHLGYSKITVAISPRKSDVCPEIPADFKRTDVVARQAKADERLAEVRVDRSENPFAAPAPAKASGDDDNDDQLPF